MLVRHRGREPFVSPAATVAPGAILSGDVVVEAGARIMHGAVLTAEDGEVRIGAETVVLEHAVIRGRSGHPAVIGSHVMIGPHAHVNGASIADDAFIATGASVFPGAVVGEGAEVRINAVVHVNTVLAPGLVVPIGWVAVGSPAQLFSPDRHDEIWAVQRTLDFPGTVYGVAREDGTAEILRRQSAFYAAHDDDVIVDEAD
ncbi:Carbonic anhydrase or acetyltransferase, isoleucine patch superfamily [Agromyces sp. CF514]|uniref:gamma carbonic anhydrase family protein n=1 Tax=Agromyces sp. CF514 TaxID=1881031 RepID=UPI0008E904FE|nr:gamma carbonic anhydrase family protein [Agromyces sp. CF514]SFR77174.1 Carbonic anhydrase or acetyltransferase, isoleucine patch superfamily [Agromyces sp. CF514]